MVHEKYNIPEMDLVITQKDMAKLLGISPRTLIRWNDEGSFVARRKPNGQPYYLKQDYYIFHEKSKERGEKHNV